MDRPNAQQLHDIYTNKVISFMEQDGYKLLSRSRMKDGAVYDFIVEKHGEIFQVKTVFLYGKTDLIMTLRAKVLFDRIVNREDKYGHFVLATNGRLYRPWEEKFRDAGIIVMDNKTEYPWNE